MQTIQPRSERDRRVFAEQVAKQLREQEQAARERPSWQTLDTVNFKKLDPENDWTDL
jgi:hypothetical protein